MTSSHPFSSRPHPFTSHEEPLKLSCPVRNEADLIAVCVHTLGFWPRDSLVILTAGEGGIGPMIRVDLADPATHKAAEYLGYFLDQLSLAPDGPFKHIFTLFFQDGTGTPATEDAETAEQTIFCRDAELDFVRKTQAFISPLQESTASRGVNLIDAIAVGESYLWSLQLPDPQLRRAQPVTAVREGELFQELLELGSEVASDQTELLNLQAWNPLETAHPQERDAWLAYAEFATDGYLREKATSAVDEMAQIYTELQVWDVALTRCAEAIDLYKAPVNDCHRHPGSALCPENPSLADRLRRQLTPDGAAYLAASLNSTATLQLVLYLACATLPQALAALAAVNNEAQKLSITGSERKAPVLPLEETLAHFQLHHLPLTSLTWAEAEEQGAAVENMAAMLCGRTSTPPVSQRLEALNLLAVLLEDIAHDKPESLFILTQAWIFWLEGKSSAADALLAAVNPEHLSFEPVILHHLLETGLVPRWLSQAATPPW